MIEGEINRKLESNQKSPVFICFWCSSEKASTRLLFLLTSLPHLFSIRMDSVSDPPFHEAYKILFDKTRNTIQENNGFDTDLLVAAEECELPVIDLSCLENSDETVREECKSHIARASQEWGFFQVVNHGISSHIFSRLRCEQEKVFRQPFEKKTKEDKFLNFSAGSYRWGAPTATCIRQLSWSEAFHIPLTDILGSSGSNSLRYVSSLTTHFYKPFIHHSYRPYAQYQSNYVNFTFRRSCSIQV